MMVNRGLDIIWNITLVCPWDCEFCCTDAAHVVRENTNIIIKEYSLQNSSTVAGDVVLKFKEKYPGVRPTKFDLALLDRQILGKELTYAQKIKVLHNLKEYNVKFDFAGGDPLACYENYLVIKEASRLFGRDSISITSTGVFIKRYGIEEIAGIIGEYEFTYDQPSESYQDSRPLGYNASNIKVAGEFSKLGVRTKAQLPIHVGNLAKERIERIYQDLCDHNISELLLMRTFPVGRGNEYLRKYQVGKAQVLNSVQCFKFFENVNKTKVRLQCALKYLYERNAQKNPCDLMHESFGINSRGELLLSAWANNAKGLPLSDDFVLGDLCKQSFEEITNTGKFQRYKKRLDENFGHCKIFAYVASENKTEDSLFGRIDPLYIEN